MPSLDDLSPNQPIMLLSIGFDRGGPVDGTLRRHFVNVIRLGDLSVHLYEAARCALERALPGNEQRLGAVLEAADYLELCVVTVRRALNAVASVVRSPGYSGAQRLSRRFLESFNKRLRPVRDAIVHIEERITGGEIGDGQSHALLVSGDGCSATIGAETLSLEDLGFAIRRLHELGYELAQYKENVDFPTAGTQ